MDDIKLAQLGDHEAARRLTDAGVLIPCPKCGKNARFEVTAHSERGSTRGWMLHVGCSSCSYHTERYELEAQISPSGGLYTVKDERPAAIEEWNTRAPILSAEEMESLAETVPPNEPLTSDELREMDGEPVWVELHQAWALVEVKQNGSVMFYGNSFSCSYSRTWQVYRFRPYRRPPEGEGNA